MSPGSQVCKTQPDYCPIEASCRARQTAFHAFGIEGTIDNSLLHRTAIKESQHAVFSQALRNLLLSVEAPDDSNVVLSGHGGTLGYDGESVIDDNRVEGRIDDREEGGFVVLEAIDGEIVAHHVFTRFSDFANEAIVLPLGNSNSQVSLNQYRRSQEFVQD